MTDTTTLIKLIEMVAEKSYHCLAVSGRSGVGKTHNLINALRKSNVNFTYVNGHCTPASMYKLLHDHRDELVVLDDLDEVWESSVTLGLLKGVLDTGNREVMWLSSTPLGEGYESSFEFNGSVIIVVNSVTRRKNPHVKALLSRAIFFEINPSRTELLDVLYNLPNSDREIVELMETYSPILDLRDYKKLTAIKSVYPLEWKTIALRLINPDPELSFVYDSIVNNVPRHTAITQYRDKFNKTERSYYRKLSMIGKITVKPTIAYDWQNGRETDYSFTDNLTQ